ncbi:MAG: hypothetical protein M1827_005124 [Pycnora praestabilis]|nr:MAG: hypothetical protein M1827_005124 [Pycnora praestabilis]
MGRIKKTAGPRHDSTTTPALTEFVDAAINIPLSRLRFHLSTFPKRWPFPRGDLYHWIPVLNRFDGIMEQFNQEYGLQDGPQTQPFGRRLLLRGDDSGNKPEDLIGASEDQLDDAGYGQEGDRELMESVLVFSKLLLENCGNRSLYNSSGCLNYLLNTTSLSLLVQTLRLAVRLAQRYHASRQRSVGPAQHHSAALLANHYNINLDKVHKLAIPFTTSLRTTTPILTSLGTTPNVKGKENAVASPSTRSQPVIPLQTTDLVAIAKGELVPPTSSPESIHGKRKQSPDSSMEIWEQWGAVSLNYYANPQTTNEEPSRNDTQVPPTNSAFWASPNPSTPTPIRRTSGLGPNRTPRQGGTSISDESMSPPASMYPLPTDDSSSGSTKTIEIPYSRVSSTPAYEILKTTLPEVPQDSKYDLLSRLRVASALSNSLATRRQILSVRMLAITNLAYIYPEPTLQQKLLQQDSDEPRRLQLAYQLAELAHPPSNGEFGVPRDLQTLALGTLEALAKHKAKAPDVCAALSVNVNHGVLLYVIRKAVAELATEDSDLDNMEEDEWREALFSLLRTLPNSTPRTGETLIAAGLLPILIDAILLRTHKAERNHPKILEFLDTFVYTVRDAFQSFANAKGLDGISDLTAFEVESSFRRIENGEGMPTSQRNQVIDYELPYFQQQTLRWLFKFMNHMMSHGGGNYDRLLRNLIDSPQLLNGLRKVLGNAKVFGSNVWSGAVNILSNFIHNEPTSYAVIAEAGLSKGLLEAVTGKEIKVPGNGNKEEEEGSSAQPDWSSMAQPVAVADEPTEAHNEDSEPHRVLETTSHKRLRVDPQLKLLRMRDRPFAHGILPATEAIATVPQAFGAICLNSAGMELFQASDALDSFFEIFESPEHVKCMNSETDLASILGGSFDELVRHHPPLKAEVMKSVMAMVARVGFLCNRRAWEKGVGAKMWLERGGQLLVSGGRKALKGPFHNSDYQALSDVMEHVKKDEGGDVEMSDAYHSLQNGQDNSDDNVTDAGAVEKEDEKEGPIVSTYINVVAKFLSGFFANTSLCTTFIERGGVDYVLDFATLPSLEYDFNNQAASQEIARIVHMLVEQKPHLVLPSLIKRTQAAVDQLEPFLGHTEDHSFFATLTDRLSATPHEQDGQLVQNVKANGTMYVKSLVVVHTLCNVLFETFSQPMFNHRSNQTVFHHVNLADMYTKLVKSLGRLHRTCVWEEIMLQNSIPEPWKEATRIKGYGIGSEEADNILGLLHHGDPSTRDSAASNPTEGSQGSAIPNPDATPATNGANGSKEDNTKTTLEQDEKTAAFKNVRTLRYLLSQIPSSITPFLQGLGKVLVAKRAPDAYPKQMAIMVAESIAEAMLEQLKLFPFEASPTSQDRQDRYAYWIVILTSVSQLMIEGPVERSHPQSLTLVLQAFKARDGFVVMRHILQIFLEEVKSVSATDETSPFATDGPARLASAYGGIKVVLTFYAQITTSKHIVEASQTTAIQSKDRDKGKPDYFSAAQFLVELRTVVLPVVRAMWDSDFVDKASSSIVKCLIEILRTVLDGEHEHGAYKRSDKISVRGKVAYKAWKVNHEPLNKLTEAGFAPDLAREALYRCNNNYSSANEYCIAQQGHYRVSRNPIPSFENHHYPAFRSMTSQPPAESETNLPEASDQPAEMHASMGPPLGADGTSILLENPQVEVEVEEANGDGSPASFMPPPPPAPGIPAEEDLAMSIDNILGNFGGRLGLPTNAEQRNGSGAEESGTSPSPNRENQTEAGKLPGIITIDDLEDARSNIRTNLIDRSLDVLNVHSDVTFELADLIMAAVNRSTEVVNMRREIGETLVQSLISLQMDDDFRPAGKKIAAYANLLALVVQDKDFYDATLEELRENFSTLIGFVKIFPDQPAEELSPWIGQILLVVEKLLAEDAQPRQIKWTPPNGDGSAEDSPIAELDEPTIPHDEKTQLYEALIEILPRIGKDESLALSVVRALVVLTRNRQLATRLGEKRNMQRLFVMVKQLAGITNDKLQSAFMLVLRHVIEDDETVKQIMRSEIQAAFETRQQRQTDTTAYTRQMYHLVLRAPETFVEVTNEKLTLVRFDSGQRPQTLTLKKLEKADEKKVKDSTEEVEKVDDKTSTLGDKEIVEKPKITEMKAPMVEYPDGVIHYLLCELLSYRDVEDQAISSHSKELNKEGTFTVQADVEMTNGESATASPYLAPASQEPKKSEKPEFKADQHPIYIYRCFLLQCLTELLSCYNRTKIEFINFSRKAEPQAMTPSKPRSGVLNYLLNALIPVGTLNHCEDISFKKKSATSTWAINVVVALCSKTGERGMDKVQDLSDGEDESDLLFVRKFVLEHALKAYKDANASSEGLDGKYAHMLNISDLFHRMILGKQTSANTVAPTEIHMASGRQLARIMYEKNFISALTSSIADIDLNFPGAKRAVKYILRPLRLLTTTAIELSESSSIATPGQTDEDEISTATSVSDLDEGREETPDLFRNSTLGMFEPGREEESSSESSEGDEDMYDDEYGDEMEFEEEMPGEDGDVISDEDEEIEGMEHMEGLPGDVGMDVEVVIDGDEDEDEDPTDDDEEGSEELEGEDISIVDEVNGDGENGSMEDGGEDEWQSQEDDEDFEGGDPVDQGDISHAIHHDSSVQHLIRALGEDGGAGMLERLEGGDLDMELDPEGYMEDDMQDDEDDEEDEEDMEEDDAIYEPDYEDEEDGMPNMPWGWDSDEPPVMGRGHHHHHHHHRGPSPWSIFPGHPQDRGMLVPTYRSHRPAGAPRGIDDGTNPLLRRNAGNGAGTGPSAAAGRAGRPEAMSDWVHAIDPSHPGRGMFSSDSPVSLINNLISAMGQGGPGLGALHHHGGSLHFHIAGGPTGGMPRELQAVLGMRRPQHENSRPSRDNPDSAVAFAPTLTTNRWQEEARILFGPNNLEKTTRVINSLLRVLVPPAMEEEKIRKEKAAEEMRKLKDEQNKRLEEELAVKERADQEAKEKQELEEREAAEKAAADAEAAAAQSQEETPLESNASAIEAPEVPEELSEDQAMEGVETIQPEAPAAEHTASGPSESATRVRTTIRGRELDITGMAIDPEYLDALPEELREEVLMHQLAEQRSQAAAAGEEPTDISREFLEALPTEIREELLQQEAQDRRRREREEARRRAATSGGPPPARAEDMDPASFLASLDPTLRQAVLMDQDEDVLAQLPQAIAAEARALGGDRRLHQFMDMPRMNRARGFDQGERGTDHISKKPQRRQIVQMLDKAGVATLLRLMFIPQQGSARHTLNGILQNVCENRQNRAEVVSLLLSILQDGSADFSAVERSFQQLSLRAKQPSSQKTPQTPKNNLTGQLTQNNMEMTPLTVVQQCLSCLVFLTQYNPHIPSFFLTEHEASVGLKSRSNKKGKGKENKASKFALNALLSLLDRKLIMESSTVMEQLSHLLQSITHPLTILLRKEKEKEKIEEAPEPTESQAPTDVTTDVTAPAEVVAASETEALAATELTDQAIPEAPTVDVAMTIDGSSTETKEGEAKKKVEEDKAKKQRTLVPPIVPESNLRLVVNILAARECSSKTFQATLSTINNLSAIPEAKEIFGKELIKQAQDLGQSILDDLDELVPQIKKAESGNDVQGMALARFSPASSDQAKLLRVLTALDYLFDPSRNNDKDKATSSGRSQEGVPAKEKDDLLPKLYENSTFGPLWNKLSECLSTIRQREGMLNVATILLPLIEALMVVCKNTTLKDTPISKSQQMELAIASPPPESRMENLFFNFTEEHRKILNDLVRQNPKLMSGTFQLLVKNPKVLEFDNKRNFFTRRLHARGTEARHPQPPLQLQVRRDQVFLDSFKSLYFKTGDEMKYGKLSIRFHGEEGVDAGGVTREWFQVLSRQMFNPDYALFTPVASDRTTFHPNRLSSINLEHFMFFKFIGRIIGKALYEGRVLDCHFSRAVYKRILGKQVSIKDMETLDLDYYKSLVWMLGNDITDIITETFSVETEAFGETQTIDLIENGRNVPVTDENKHEYVRLVVEYRLTGSVQEQLDHFLRGFHDIVPAELISIFNEQELELLISGLPDIDVDDWKNNTEYHNYSASSSQIQWFWRAVRSFDKEERAKLLQFVTGTSKVPLNGFKELEGMNGFSRFNIHRDYGSKDRLPSSHTCFNQLDLPEYESYEALRQQVYTAMTAGSEYFGFA